MWPLSLYVELLREECQKGTEGIITADGMLTRASKMREQQAVHSSETNLVACSLYIPMKRTQYTKMHLGNWWSHGECDPYKYSEILLPFWLLSRQCELQLSFDIYYSLLTCVNMFWWYWSRKTDWVPRCFSSSPQKSSTGSQCHLKNSTV